MGGLTLIDLPFKGRGGKATRGALRSKDHGLKKGSINEEDTSQGRFANRSRVKMRKNKTRERLGYKEKTDGNDVQECPCEDEQKAGLAG